jgi:hypothetical protein
MTFQKGATAMDAPSKTSIMRAKTFLLLVTVAVFLMQAPVTSSFAGMQEERVFENTLPKEVPLKVKIKKEKEQSFKDLKNEKWVRELELELTNTGDKPIYFLDMFLRTNVAPGIEVMLEDGVREGRLGLTIEYGRAELGDIISKPGPDDVPIKPGETYIFTIHPGEVGGWEIGIRDGAHPQPTRVQLVFQSLSFGDGTGLFGAGGQPYSPPPRKQ